MKKALYKCASYGALAAALHLSFLDLAAAQTSNDMRDAAGQANTNEFKLDPSSLYTNQTGSNVEIIGVTPSGNVTVPSSEFFYGVEGQGEASGALPHVDTYEELYGHRNQELGNLQLGTGRFTATGDLNAEASAFEVLAGSQGTRSVASDEFLQTTRDLLLDIDGATAEFGECVIQHVTETNTHTYDDSYKEVCDMPALDLEPMPAERTYDGPPHVFTTSSSGGQLYCNWAGRRVAVDSATTCSKLSILTGIPTTNGTLSVRECSGVAGCIEFVLSQTGQSHAVNVNFTVHPNINVTNAFVRGDSSNPGTVAYQGNSRAVSSSFVSIPEVATTEGSAQVFSVYKSNGVTRQPSSGYTYNLGSTYWIGYGLHWNGRRWTTPQNATSYRASDGWTYYRNCTNATQARCNGVWRTRPNPSGFSRIFIRVQFNPQPFSPWLFNAARWAEIQSLADNPSCSITYTTLETAAKPNGCVNSLAGELCGPSIPVTPFDALPDRASTRIEVGLNCGLEEMVDEEGNAAFTEMGGTCQELIDNPLCTFSSRQCGDTLPDGSCLFYEDTYTCGGSMEYTSPVVKEINICDSTLSCMGDDCIVDTSTDGSIDLAETAAQLAAVDMILGDMNCSVDPDSPSPGNDLRSCEIFKGEAEECKKVTLGLANCCKTPSGVSLADYLQLAFATSRLARVVEGTSLANPVTSAWVDLTDLGRNSFSKLTQPLTEAWESIIGNSGAGSQGVSNLSVSAVKQSLMKNAAQWTAEIFGEQAANALFQVGGGPAVSNGVVQSGTIGLNGAAATVMSTVMVAYAIYTIINVLAAILFACTEEEQELMVRKALKSTHEIGTYCSSRFLGSCVKKKTAYCMFNSPLARIFNEQARLQTGVSWGEPEHPNCQGITLEQFQALDMDRVDLSEWTGMMISSGMIDTQALSDIEQLTGQNSTLGKALDDLYDRENAIDRNVNRLDGTDLDAARQDAVDDFGRGVTQ